MRNRVHEAKKSEIVAVEAVRVLPEGATGPG